MIEVDRISKAFGERRAIDDVSFEVRPGRMTGFIGGNGAGKTTTMRIMLGVLEPDAGAVRLDGRQLTPADRRLFGYMPEERGLYPKMRLAEQIVYFGRLHGMPRRDAERATAALLARLDLAERARDDVESLSLGNQQRAQIAAALVHAPRVLILDEPFSGLDPIAVETVSAVLVEEAARGVPVLFSSHQLELVERLCDDLVIISDGRVRATGSRDALRDEHGGDRVELVVSGDAGWMREIAGVRVVELDGGRAVVEPSSPEALQALVRRAVEVGSVLGVAPARPTLAQIFREVVS